MRFQLLDNLIEVRGCSMLTLTTQLVKASSFERTEARSCLIFILYIRHRAIHMYKTRDSTFYRKKFIDLTAKFRGTESSNMYSTLVNKPSKKLLKVTPSPKKLISA